MKYFILAFSLLIAGATFSQSKKKQIEILQHQLDSVTEVNVELQESNKELLRLNTILSKESKTLRGVAKYYVVQIDSLLTVNRNLVAKIASLEGKGSTSEDKDETSSSNPSTTNSTNSSSGNPFGDGGNTGGGNGFGVDAGSRNGSGEMFGKGRTRLNNVSVHNFQIDEEATIYFKLTVDSKGNVVAFNHLKSKTTTTNMVLINKLGTAIEKQVKYNKEVGAPLTYQFYTIHIKPN